MTKPSITTVKCGPCCKSPGTCIECDDTRCLPRYLCVKAKITGVSPYDHTCHCESVNGRLVSNGCGWTGVVACGQDSLSFIINVVKDIYGNCVTEIECPELTDETIVVDGALPEVIEFSGTDNNLVSYDVTISRAPMIINPRYQEKCTKCFCASCLPSKFCITFRSTDGDLGSSVISYLCETEKWEGEIHYGYDTLSVSISISTTECALIVSAGGQEFIISLETTTETPGGITCTEARAMSLRRNYSPFQNITYNTMIDVTIPIGEGLYYIGDLSIIDSTCGNSCSNECPITFVGPTPCCPDTKIPTVMYCSFTGCTTGSMVLNYDSGWIWRGTGPDGFEYSLMCMSSTWILGSDFGCNFTSGTVGCDPFELSFSFDNIRCPPPHCDGFTVIITF